MIEIIESHPVYPLAAKFAFDVVPADAVFSLPITPQDVRHQITCAFVAGVIWAAEQQNAQDRGAEHG